MTHPTLHPAIQDLVERDAADATLNPVCRTRFFGRPERTAQAVVFLHGLTSCPRQFQPLAEILAAQGVNALTARMPYHGYADRMTDELGRLRERDLADWAVDMAERGKALGERVVIAGLSVGGACAAHAAQNVAGLKGALILAPLLRTPAVPLRWTRQAAWLFSVLPNQWRWWDPVLKDTRTAPDFSYPRLSTRAVAAALGLSQRLLAAAGRTAPACKRTTLVLNENDRVVHNPSVRELASLWQARGADARLHAFEAGAGLAHDLVGAEHPEQKVDVVYPVVLSLLNALFNA